MLVPPPSHQKRFINKSRNSRLYFDLEAKTQREKCPNTEFFLVRIFPHSDWIWRDTPCLFVFSPNEGQYGPEKTSYLDTFHAMKIANYFSIFSICSKYMRVTLKGGCKKNYQVVGWLQKIKLKRTENGYHCWMQTFLNK